MVQCSDRKSHVFPYHCQNSMDNPLSYVSWPEQQKITSVWPSYGVLYVAQLIYARSMASLMRTFRLFQGPCWQVMSMRIRTRRVACVLLVEMSCKYSNIFDKAMRSFSRICPSLDMSQVKIKFCSNRKNQCY